MAWTGVENKRLRDLARSGLPLRDIVRAFPDKTRQAVYNAVRARGLVTIKNKRCQLVGRGLLAYIVSIQTIAFGFRARPW